MDLTQPLEGDTDFHFVIDAAGGAAPRLYKEDPVGVMRSNLNGVDHLFQYGVRHALQRFLYVSSAKRATETLCACYGAQYHFEVVVGRPSHVYGPGFTESDNRVYAQFIRNVERGEDIVLKSKGEAFRSWTYVVDCATALLHILLLGKDGEAYNVADEQSNITIRQLAELTAGMAGRQVVFDIPDDATHGVTTPITKAVFDTRRLQSLGWQSLWHIEEGLRHTVDQR